MAMMKPPKGAQGVRYNYQLVKDGDAVEVLECDAESLIAEGWTSTSPAPVPILDDENTPHGGLVVDDSEG